MKQRDLKATAPQRFSGSRSWLCRPGDREIRIKMHATTVSQSDVHMRRSELFLARLYDGLFKPRRITVLGFELAGVVDAVGKEVQRFKAGDLVFGFTGFGFGAYAESFVCLKTEF